MFRIFRKNLFRFCFLNKPFLSLKIDFLSKLEDFNYVNQNTASIANEFDSLSDFSDITKIMEQIYTNKIKLNDELLLKIITKSEILPSDPKLSSLKTLIIFISFTIKKYSKFDLSSFRRILPKLEQISKNMTLPAVLESERLFINSFLLKEGKEVYFNFFKSKLNEMDERNVLTFLLNIRKLTMFSVDHNFVNLLKKDQEFLTALFSKIKIENKDANAISSLIISFSIFKLQNRLIWDNALLRSCSVLPTMSDLSLSQVLGNASNNFRINSKVLNSFSNEFLSRLKNDIPMNTRCFTDFIRNLVNRNIQKNTVDFNEDLLSELKRYIIKNNELFRINEIITLINFYAVINYEDKGFIKGLEEKIYLYKDRIDVDLIAIFMYAICILEMYSQSFLNFVTANLNNIPFDKLNRNNFAMIIISLFSIDIEVDNSFNKSPQLNESLRKYLPDYQNVSLRYLSKIGSTSTLANMETVFDFFTYAKCFGFEVISEPIFYCYNVDFVIKNYKKVEANIEKAIENLEKNEAELKASLILKVNNKKERSQIDLSPDDDLIVEIDGPRHYIKDRIKGGTLLKRRLTKKLGYKMVVLSSKECLKLAKIGDKKMKLTNFLNIIFASI